MPDMRTILDVAPAMHTARVMTRWTLPVGVVTGLFLAASLLGCGKRPPPGVAEHTIEDPIGFYEREGYVLLVPPVHLPSSASDIDQVEIWMKLPDGPGIEVGDDDAAARLRFPPGTIVDRVEFDGRGDARHIVDVRGATIEADQTQSFHVYRPVGPGPHDKLVGVAWPAEDIAITATATDHFIGMLEQQWPARGMAPDARTAFAEDVRRKNACAGCHLTARPDNTVEREHGIVNRGTDLSGFFTPSTVLQDATPLEFYGRFDRSLADRAIEIHCGSARVDGQDLEERRCTDGEIPVGTWNWEAARTHNPQRATQMCRSRRYLTDHLAQADRERFAASKLECETTYRENL